MIAALLIAACTPPAPAAGPTSAPAAAAGATSAPAANASASDPNRVLKVVIGSEPLSLDPSVDVKDTSLIIDFTYMEALASQNADQTISPLLAESWSQVTPTKWRFKLRQGVKFQNGEPFNADAVAFSLDTFHNTKGDAKGQYSYITSSEKVDDYTIDFNTDAPAAHLPSTLPKLFMVPPKYYAQVGPEGFGKKPVGTGAWKFVEWQPGNVLKVEPNPDYWGKKPAIGAIQFQWAPEASARAALIQTGAVDIAQNIPPSFVDQVNGSSSAHIATVQSMRNMFLQMNTREGPTKDVRVRQALNYAIDKDTIIKTLFQGRAYPEKGINNYVGFEGYEGDKLQAWPYDPNKAKQLLADAGFPNGLDLPFYTVQGSYQLDKESADAIAAQFAKVGVRSTLTVRESGQYFTMLAKTPGATDLPRSADGYLIGLNLNSCAPSYLNAMGCATYYLHYGPLRAYGADDKTDAYFNQWTSEVDASKRIQIVHDMNDYVYNQYVPWVWLWRLQDIYGVSNNLNWQPRADGYMGFNETSFK
jgi:peptide/nickel transport system substrate-binding protein